LPTRKKRTARGAQPGRRGMRSPTYHDGRDLHDGLRLIRTAPATASNQKKGLTRAGGQHLLRLKSSRDRARRTWQCSCRLYPLPSRRKPFHHTARNPPGQPTRPGLAKGKTPQASGYTAQDVFIKQFGNANCSKKNGGRGGRGGRGKGLTATPPHGPKTGPPRRLGRPRRTPTSSWYPPPHPRGRPLPM